MLKKANSTVLPQVLQSQPKGQLDFAGIISWEHIAFWPDHTHFGSVAHTLMRLSGRIGARSAARARTTSAS